MATPATFHHYPQAQSTFSPPLIANGNAFLGDVFSSQPLSPTAPISAGLYRLAPGPALDYTYTYHEMKIVLEGDFTITLLEAEAKPESQTETTAEAGSGVKKTETKTVNARPGDVFWFEKGSRIRFETVGGGLAFYTGQRDRDAA